MCAGVTLQSAATHTSRADKTCVELMWIAPSSGTGCIKFRLAMFVMLTIILFASDLTTITVNCMLITTHRVHNDTKSVSHTEIYMIYRWLTTTLNNFFIKQSAGYNTFHSVK